MKGTVTTATSTLAADFADRFAGPLAAWQNHPHHGPNVEAIRALIELGGFTVEAELSRGMIVHGTTAQAVANEWTGPVALDPSSFTTSEAVSDAFAGMDLSHLPAGDVRVKLFVEGAEALPVSGDPTFTWEAEWIVAGRFDAAAEVLDPKTVLVILTPTA